MLVFSLFVVFLSSISVINADYVAAVAEHTTFMGNENDSNDYKKSMNLEIYENLTSLAAANGVQVLVFPEFGLVSSKQDTRESLYGFAERIGSVDSANPVTPCDQKDNYSDRPILYRMSCAAKKHNLSILVNLVDWVDCDASNDAACPSDKHYQYNTAIVFNEKGALVSRYYKSHEWPGLLTAYDQYPLETQVTYKSSFGVEFGIFICFDIMWDNPPKQLRANGIEHFLYPVQQGKMFIFRI
jgi:pantetheine hydrolase